MSTLTRSQNTINSRLAKHSATGQFKISDWVSLPHDADHNKMYCVNTNFNQLVEFTDVELKADGDKYPDEKKKKTVSQCICGVRINDTRAYKIWNPSYDPTRYANLGSRCFDILCNGMEDDQKKRFNKHNNISNKSVKSSLIKPIRCLGCNKNHKSIHLTFASDNYINYHVKCMPIEMVYDFNNTYSHYGIKQNIAICRVCDKYLIVSQLNTHMATHNSFIESCKYKLKYGKYTNKTLWDVYNEGYGKYIIWLINNTSSEYLIDILNAFMNGIENDLKY